MTCELQDGICTVLNTKAQKTPDTLSVTLYWVFLFKEGKAESVASRVIG